MVAAALAWTVVGIHDPLRRYVVGWSFMVAVPIAMLMARGMRKSLTVDAPWFLYWDRYFFSEVLPLFFLAGAIGVATLWAKGELSGGWRRHGARALVTLLVIGWALDSFAPVRRATEQRMFADAYGELNAVVQLMPRDEPLVYDGLVRSPSGWFWPNSSRVLAEPLVETFGRRVLNRAAVLSADPTPTADEVVALLEGAGTRQGYVLQVSDVPRWVSFAGSGLDVDVRGELLIPIERLEGRSAVAPEDQRWITSELWVRVLHVSTP